MLALPNSFCNIICRDVTENIDRYEWSEMKKSRHDEEEAGQLMLRRRWERWKGLITRTLRASNG